VKKATLAAILLSLLYVAPATSAAVKQNVRDVELREATIRDRDDAALLPRLMQAIAKHLGLVRSNTDASMPPRP
jgi:hypothetical protein